jgi:phosphoribosylglycinamide formyltransferase
MPTLPDTKVTVLISAEGSNLQALIDASLGEGTTMPYLKIIRVISNKVTANGLNRAKKASIATEYQNLVKHGYYKQGEKDPVVKQAAREKYDAQLAEIIIRDSPNLVVTAGWMHILSPSFLDPLAQKVVPAINPHRSSWNV